MSANDLAPPPLPRRALRIGVTGHRKLPAEVVPPLRAAIADVLRRVLAAMRQVTDAPGLDCETPPRAILVSPLAAGADQLVAEEAVALGYELHVLLPYAEEAYVAELSAEDDAAAEEARRTYWRLAEARPRLAMGAGPEPESRLPGPRPYDALGRLVAENTDLLLAVWDGGPGKGRGGTAHVVRSAHAMGLPVVRIHVRRGPEGEDAAPLPREERHWPTGEVRLTVAENAGPGRGEGIEAIDGKVQELLSPWRGPAAQKLLSTPHGAADDAHERRRDAENLRSQVRHLEEFLRERPPARRPRAERWGRGLLAGSWRRFRSLFSRQEARSREFEVPATSRDGELEQQHRWVSALADHYMPLYRGAFLVVYLLGALAVLTALLPLLCAALQAGPAGGAMAALLWAAILVEGACLASIVHIVRRSRRGRWHQRAIDYRILAELLRHTRRLAPLGLAAPNTRPRAHLSGEVDLTLTWVVSQYRAILRSAGVPEGDLLQADVPRRRDQLAESWIGEQVAYHEATRERQEGMGHALERAVNVCFVSAILCFGAHVVAHAAHAEGWSATFAALAAGLPAVAAACHGIRTQGEMDRLAKRSASMARRLEDMRRRLLETPAEVLEWPELVELARRASQAMIEELDDWQALSRGLEVPTP